MYVCICNKIPEHLIITLIDQGWGIEQITDATGCSQNCGACLQYLEQLILSKNIRKSTILPIDIV